MDRQSANTVKAEDSWLPARLIPTSGIKGEDERERRATSALLAVMTIVPQFASALLKKTGAPAGKLTAYIETPFKSADGKGVRPDGAIIIRRGSNEWKAFVEVKTSNRDLEQYQVEAYLDLARDNGFDAVITISNQMNTAVDDHPLSVSKLKTRKVGLHHYSWVAIATEAFVQQEFRTISDPEQAWILSELIAYLKSEQSGAAHYHDMGQHWVTVRDGARDKTLRRTDESVADVVNRWDQFIQFLVLSLSGDLGVKVAQVLSRKESDSSARRSALTQSLVETGKLSGTIRVQNAAGDITLTASLSERVVSVSVELDAPREGQPQTQINWLLRQLRQSPDDLVIDAWYPLVRHSIPAKLGDLRNDPKLLRAPDPKKEPRSFVITRSAEMGTKRAGTVGSFTEHAKELLRDFYREVVQPLKPWTASAPKLREELTQESAEEIRAEAIEHQQEAANE